MNKKEERGGPYKMEHASAIDDGGEGFYWTT